MGRLKMSRSLLPLPLPENERELAVAVAIAGGGERPSETLLVQYFSVIFLYWHWCVFQFLNSESRSEGDLQGAMNEIKRKRMQSNCKSRKSESSTEFFDRCRSGAE
nr:hypothetical protein M569_12984 [Ipomoea batatas]